jgi:hypothetical protein
MPKTKLTDLAKKAREEKKVVDDPNKTETKRKIEKLLDDINLTPKTPKVGVVEKQEVSLEWLTEEIGKLTKENEQLRTGKNVELEKLKRDVVELYKEMIYYWNEYEIRQGGVFAISKPFFDKMRAKFPFLSKN